MKITPDLEPPEPIPLGSLRVCSRQSVSEPRETPGSNLLGRFSVGQLGWDGNKQG